MAIIKRAIDREEILPNGKKKIVFVVEDDVHGGYQTDVHIDELHEALLPVAPAAREAALRAALSPILDNRVSKWLASKETVASAPAELPALFSDKTI